MDTPSCQYSLISRELVRTLREATLMGESTALMGPRFTGKRWLMDELCNDMARLERLPVISFRFMQSETVTSEEQVRVLIQQTVARQFPELELPITDDLLAPIDAIAQAGRGQVFLAGANVDALGRPLARRVLQGVRTRVESGQLISVISMEADFSDLIYGPNSVFNCAVPYVLQGHAIDTFSEFFERYTGALKIDSHEIDCSINDLWNDTRGNTALLRMVLWEIVENRSRPDASRSALVVAKDLKSRFQAKKILGSYGGHIFRHAVQVVAGDPTCWSALQELLRCAEFKLGPTQGFPTTLEFAGIARRRFPSSGGRAVTPTLTFASPILADFCRRYYHDLRFGDLYARVGDWDEAFVRYERAAKECRERLSRPIDADDREDTELSVRSLASAFYSQAMVPGGLAKLESLVVRGCRLLLGYPNAVLLQRSSGGDWKELPERGNAGSTAVRKAIALLPSSSELRDGFVSPPRGQEHLWTAVLMPSVRSTRVRALVVGDLVDRTEIAPDRLKLTEELLSHFCRAYSQAVDAERAREQLRVRDQQSRITSEIFSELGSKVMNVKDALRIAAKGLRELGYRRVLICRLDPLGERICGVYDSSDDPSVDVAAATDWPLSRPKADIQPYVIWTKRRLITPDARKEPLANKPIVRQANMKAQAIVPILGAGAAIGTIHVERIDGDVPTEEEADDLQAFGKLLAVAIEQSERVNLIQSALDEVPEPVVLVDRRKRVRYGNVPAKDLFGVDPCWVDREKAGELPPTIKGTEVSAQLSAALEDATRQVSNRTGVGCDPGYYGAVLTVPIRDSQSKVVGALLHIQDLNYEERLFLALKEVATAENAREAVYSLLRAVHILGHGWGRLYLADPASDDPGKPDRMRCKLCFDELLPEPHEPDEPMELLRDQQSSEESWRCLDEKKAVLFRFDPKYPHGKVVSLPNGLLVTSLATVSCHGFTAKAAGDLWIDLPLVVRDMTEIQVGKLTLECPPRMGPAHYELLKVFSDLSASLLNAAVVRDQIREEREKLIQETAEQSMGAIAHNLGSQMASLPVLIARFSRAQTDARRLQSWFGDLRAAIDQAQATLRRAKDLLGRMKVRSVPFDLKELLESQLRRTLAEGSWTVLSKPGMAPVCADPELLRSALSELLDNSRGFERPTQPLRVEVEAHEVERDGVRWLQLIYMDNGPGVPEEIRDRIFEDFYSHRPGQDTGLGLGLAFVRRVVQRHGGKVSERGSGSGVRFELEFPAVPGVNAAETEEKNVPSTGG